MENDREEETPVPKISFEDTATSDVATKNSAVQATLKPLIDNNNTVRDLTDKALTFLSNASNETLGACLVGLGATTYLILGRVGLVLIGVVGGVALHAAWEGKSGDLSTQSLEEQRRKEIGLDVIHRVLSLRASHKGEATAENDVAKNIRAIADTRLDFLDFRDDTAKALDEITEAVVRDYVKWWYSPILPAEAAFPAVCRRTLVSFIRRFSTQLSRKRPADVFLDFATNSSATLTVVLSELSVAVTASPNATVADAVGTYVESKPDSSLATLIEAGQQEAKLNMVAHDILECYIDPAVYSCGPARVFLQQILAKVVLDMTITSCSRPEFINNWIVYLLQDGEPEIMKDIDAGIEGGPGKSSGVEISDKSATETEKQRIQHQAQEAMDDAMQEAQRLSQMIAEHDAERSKTDLSIEPVATIKSDATQSEPSPTIEAAAPIARPTLSDDASESTTQGVNTPTSSSQENPLESEEQSTASNFVDSALPGQVDEESVAKQPFTSFDQLVPESSHAYSSTPKAEVAPMTLHNARVSIFDGSDPNSRQAIKNKPTSEYMIQIEPASSSYSGWMIIRKYADFENLHEVLSRIAKITGATVFTQSHPLLPQWKGVTEERLRESLERYLVDAVRYQSLAESGGMKLFLEKEQAASKNPGQKSGFGWPTPSAFENMGKGMIDALAKAPKEMAGGVAGGSKAIFGGVSGVLGKKEKRASVVGSPSPAAGSRSSMSLSRSSTAANGLPTLPDRPSMDRKTSESMSGSRPLSMDSPVSRPLSIMEESGISKPLPSASEQGEQSIQLPDGEVINLPPRPSDTEDDFLFSAGVANADVSKEEQAPALPTRREPAASSADDTPQPTIANTESTITPSKSSNPPPKQTPREFPPLTTQETTIIIELLFATINALYTLSSAWSLRRTLLNAAKTYLLRPANPQLLSIQTLIQQSVLEANTKDSAIAAQIRGLRANALPTEEELKAWPKELGAEEKEALRVRARRLLCERGMPVALTGVMGMQASGEALGRVFDALQVKEVARGVVFGLVLQAVRGVTQ